MIVFSVAGRGRSQKCTGRSGQAKMEQLVAELSKAKSSVEAHKKKSDEMHAMLEKALANVRYVHAFPFLVFAKLSMGIDSLTPRRRGLKRGEV